MRAFGFAEDMISTARRRVSGTVLALVLGAGLHGAAHADKARAPGPTGAQPAPAGTAGPAPAADRIYLSIDRDGRATFSDHAQPGAQTTIIRSYPSASDERSLARAREERAYWQAQADAFAARQRARDRELAQETTARRAAERGPTRPDGLTYRWVRVGPPLGSGAAPSQAPAGNYTGSPGAAARAGSGFIGSGFATSR